MSQLIETAFVKQYHDAIEMILQQLKSQLRGTVREEGQVGEEQYFEQVGPVELSEVTTRHADSPMLDTPHLRRRVTLRQFDAGDALDNFDKVKMLIDPASSYNTNFKAGAERRVDYQIIGRTSLADSSTVDGGFFGTAFTGKNGATAVTFPAGNIIAVDFGSTGTNSNLTVNKVIEADRLLRNKFNIKGQEPWYTAISSSQLASMLKTTQVTSADYANVKALVKGEVDTFMGFDFRNSEFLLETAPASAIRRIPVWVKSGALLSIGKDIEANAAQRPDKRFMYYYYVCVSLGFTRMQEDKVLEIRCDETK